MSGPCARLWTAAGSTEGQSVADWFGATEGGNFEGANILTRKNALTTTPHTIQRAMASMLDSRSQRVRPALDHKIVAAWNGLAIRAFAEAGAVLGRHDYLAEARAAARFVLEEMRADASGRLSRVWAKGRRGGPGFLEDYGAMATGLFALYQATGEEKWYAEADGLTREIPRLFSDPSGGFFATGVDTERLIARPKDLMDNPSPSGNSLAAEALLTLGQYTGEMEWWSRAEEAVRDGGLLMEKAPSAMGSLLAVAHALHTGPQEVALVGPDAARWAREVHTGRRRGLVLAFTEDPHLAESGCRETVPLLRGRGAQGRPSLTCAAVSHARRPSTTSPRLRKRSAPSASLGESGFIRRSEKQPCCSRYRNRASARAGEKHISVGGGQWIAIY